MKTKVEICVCEVDKTQKGFPEGNCVEFIAWINQKLSLIPKQYRDAASIDISSESDYDEGHCVNIEISYMRPQTDEEEATSKSEMANKQHRMAIRELKELDRLKAKYEQK